MRNVASLGSYSRWPHAASSNLIASVASATSIAIPGASARLTSYLPCALGGRNPTILSMGAFEFRLGDVNCDGAVGVLDLLSLLARWEDCDSETPCTADLDHNGVVNAGDPLLVLSPWGAHG